MTLWYLIIRTLLVIYLFFLNVTILVQTNVQSYETLSSCLCIQIVFV